MTSVDQHCAVPSDSSELLGATHAWRSMLRQAASQLSYLEAGPTDPAIRLALRDAVQHLHETCSLLTSIDTVLDSAAPERRRQHAIERLIDHSRVSRHAISTTTAPDVAIRSSPESGHTSVA